MNEAYELKRTGSLKCDRPTTIRHILAHIENARNFFGIKGNCYGEPFGFSYNERFPDYINRVTREIDIRYSINRDRMFKYIEPQEVDYATEEDYSGEWPSIVRNYSHGIFDDRGRTPDAYANDNDQVRIWISNFIYMLHDASVSYIYAIGEAENEKRKIDGTDEELRAIACNIMDWKSSSREDAQIEQRRMVERECGIEWKDGKPYVMEKV